MKSCSLSSPYKVSTLILYLIFVLAPPFAQGLIVSGAGQLGLSSVFGHHNMLNVSKIIPYVVGLCRKVIIGYSV